MKRRPFSEVLKEIGIDLKFEYNTLYRLFCREYYYYNHTSMITLREYCDRCFKDNPCRDTCISLRDFDKVTSCYFSEYPKDFDINCLLNFCEYSYNLVINTRQLKYSKISPVLFRDMQNPIDFYINQVKKVVSKLGYMENKENNTVTFVPMSQTAISVSEIVDSDLAYNILEYNHHSMKGDIERKRKILTKLAHKIRPKERTLSSINHSLKSNLTYLFNNLNIRHNNKEQGSDDFRPYFARMKKTSIEKWYDETYQLSLLALLECDNIKRNKKIIKLKQSMETAKNKYKNRASKKQNEGNKNA